MQHPGTVSLAEIQTFFESEGKTVVTFVGYSGSGYEHPDEMLEQAGRVLDEFDPDTTIVNIGVTPDGIGAVYELAKQRGFVTSGIVSTQAKESGVDPSPFVDHAFYVEDATWGGRLEGTDRLSPTSTAMVECSDVFVGIGGGEVARDEMLGARRRGLEVRFIPAEMNHRKAIEKAEKKGQPEPTDFRGAAHAIFGSS